MSKNDLERKVDSIMDATRQIASQVGSLQRDVNLMKEQKHTCQCNHNSLTNINPYAKYVQMDCPKTYPDGYVSYEDWDELVTETIYEARDTLDDIDTIMAGVQLVDRDSDERTPLVPIRFYSDGPYYIRSCASDEEGISDIEYEACGPMPIIIGDRKTPKGIYMDFECPIEGLKMVRNLCDNLEKAQLAEHPQVMMFTEGFGKDHKRFD